MDPLWVALMKANARMRYVETQNTRVRQEMAMMKRTSCGPMTIAQFVGRCFANKLPTDVQQRVLSEIEVMKRLLPEIAAYTIDDMRIVVDGDPSSADNVVFLAPCRDGSGRWRVLATRQLEIPVDFTLYWSA